MTVRHKQVAEGNEWFDCRSWQPDLLMDARGLKLASVLENIPADEQPAPAETVEHVHATKESHRDYLYRREDDDIWQETGVAG